MSLVTGTVTLSLAEVDTLRNAVIAAEKKVEEINKELLDVRADKRVLKITEEKVPEYSIYVDEYAIVNILQNKHNYRAPSYYDTQYELKRCVRVNFQPNKESSKEFVNFDDVKAELAKSMNTNLTDEIGRLRTQIQNSDIEKSELKETHSFALDAIRKGYDKKLDEANEVINEWKKKYDDLENDRDTRTTQKKLEDRIGELQKELETEKKKTWYSKLFGK